MSFHDSPDYATLARVLRDPSHIERLSPEDLSRFLDAASAARLLGWALTRCRDARPSREAPPWLHDRLHALEAHAAGYGTSCGHVVP